MTRPQTETFFCDTSVLVAATDIAHQHHAKSVAIVSRATPENAYCTAHALAELYSTFSGGRYLRLLSLAQVEQLVARVRSIFTVMTLTDAEYTAALREAAERQIRGGRIYDALHMYAAEQSKASIIYTWNDKDFRAVASPEIAKRIRTP